jgi:hypothetical protein
MVLHDELLYFEGVCGGILSIDLPLRVQRNFRYIIELVHLLLPANSVLIWLHRVQIARVNVLLLFPRGHAHKQLIAVLAVELVYRFSVFQLANLAHL